MSYVPCNILLLISYLCSCNFNFQRYFLLIYWVATCCGGGLQLTSAYFCISSSRHWRWDQGIREYENQRCWLVPCWRFDAGCRLIDGAWDSKHERLLTFIKESSPQMFHFWDSEKRRFLCNTRKERFEEQPSSSILSIIYGLWSVWVYCLLWLFISRHLRRKNEMFSVLMYSVMQHSRALMLEGFWNFYKKTWLGRLEKQ